MTGYLHPGYAESLAEFGKPHPLPRCGGHLLARQIPNTDCMDAMGCYPLFCCQDWTRLGEDLEELRGRMVSIALVTDPFGNYDEALLRRCFDRVTPFKQHFVTDLNLPATEVVCRHHRYEVRRALKTLEVEFCAGPIIHLDEWCGLYDELIRRHGLGGLKAFSRRSFSAQLTLPGMVMFRAVHQGKAVGAYLWLVQGNVAYGHLAGLSPEGYARGASYAIMWAAMEYFRGKLRFLTFGAGAGFKKDATDGLTTFKRGWSTGVRQVYFCGLTLDPVQYEALTRARGGPATEHFPAYRQGEF